MFSCLHNNSPVLKSKNPSMVYHTIAGNECAVRKNTSSAMSMRRAKGKFSPKKFFITKVAHIQAKVANSSQTTNRVMRNVESPPSFTNGTNNNGVPILCAERKSL